MRGPKPVPTALKVARGNPSHRKLNHDEPQPGALDTACPDELIDPVARAEWKRRIVPAVSSGQIAAADFVCAVAHCDLWATWQSQLTDAARDKHVVYVGKNGYPIPNTARVMSQKTLLIFLKVDAELGFSPTSRSRVTVGNHGTAQKTHRRFFGPD